MSAQPDRFELAPGAFVRLRGGRGLEVSVDSGRLWITEEARNDDLWLGPGETARLAGDGLALIEALAPSSFCLE